MDIKFEGDLTAFTPESEGTCRRAIQELGFNNCVVQVEPVGKKGDNYVANVKRLIMQQNDVNNGEPIKMIVKIAPTQMELRQVMSTDIAFNNEMTVYNELLPKYEELQEQANVPLEERLKFPVCYGVYSEAPNETIILEDITQYGYEMLSRFVSMTNDQAKLALQELAKFHALSYVLKDKDQEFFDRIKQKLLNIWVIAQNSEDMKQYVNIAEEDTQNMLKNDMYKKRIKGIIANMITSTVAMHTTDTKSRHSAIIQGDCWTNNMMFKSTNGTPEDIILLDYQITRLASPAADFFYFTLNCADYETRKKHFNEWLDHYYKSLEDFLSNFGIKANYVYPRDKFEADMLRNGKPSFGISIMLANMLVRESEDTIDFKDDPSILNNPEAFSVNSMGSGLAERYNNRVEGLIQSCIDFGYI